MNLICVRYFDDMYVVIRLVVSCERRLHVKIFGPKGMNCGVVIR